MFLFRPQSSSSPRRVAVPVLVKDGKPCSGSSNSTPVQQQLTSSGSTIGNSSNTINLINVGSGIGGNSSETVTSNNQHSPNDSPSTTILSSYNSGGGHQMLQQPCNNNTLMSNSLAMAYRNQNNFMGNSHQQQHCGSYLPLQGRAW